MNYVLALGRMDSWPYQIPLQGEAEWYNCVTLVTMSECNPAALSLPKGVY